MINYNKIKDLLKDLSVDNESYRISYSMVPITSNNVYEEEGTKLVDLKATVSVEVKTTGEKAEFVVDLLRIPHYGESGFIIKGTNKQVISMYTIAYGWYVMPADNKIPYDHLKLTTERGYNLLIYAEDYTLYVTNGRKRNSPSVPLSVFLKALSGKSFNELRSMIGMDSVYVTKSFSIEEPIRSDCIDQVVRTLITKYADDIRYREYLKLSIDHRYRILAASFIDGYYMNLGNTTGVRMKRSTSFKERCKNLYLAKSLEVNGRFFDKQTNLDSKTLEIIDYLPVDKLDVMSLDRKYFSVHKASVFNFRALGMTLEEDVKAGNRTIPKGTVLDLEDLKELDKTNLTSILVSYNGSVTECTRDLFDGRLKVKDIISMVQVYIDTLSGLPLYDNIYDLTNQNLATLDIKVAYYVTNNCRYINDTILGQLDSEPGRFDLLERVLKVRRPPLDNLLEYVKDPRTRESQQAEINNTIQRVSKEHRVSKNVRRSTSEMVSVQESQFGRLDPIESPESSKIGMVHSLTYFAKTDEFGFISSPFIRVNNGEIVDTNPVYLTADEQKGQFIASWDETFYEELPDGTKKKKDYVLALTDDTIMKVPIEDVKYMQVGPYDTMSPARMQIPFSEHSAQKRILMGSNHHKQAVAPINNERPIVSSGGDSLIDDGIITAEKLLSEYYDAQEGTIGVPKEEFLKARIKLVSVDTVKNFKVLGLEILDYKGHVIKTEIPFMQKASSGAMFSYIVNNDSLEYAGKDVVAYSSDYDIRKYNIYKHTNFGNMKVDESKFERALGLAKNLVVGWKTHESSTIDDAIVIRQGLTDMNGYTTIELHAITYELKNEESNRITNISESEYFGFGGKSHYPHLNDNGLPKIGTVLQSGEVVLVTRIEKREHSRASASKIAKQHLNPVVLEGKQEGQVVFAGIEGKEARILLANVKHIEKGDKMSGRHGNKGVIAKILPDHLMPFDPETGLVLDVVLNPLGIPSRSNISQLLEALLGFAMKKKGQICVVSPFKGDTLEFVKNMGKEVNIHPMIMRDGRTGKMFDRPINVGVMYMLQLEHKVSSKMKGIGISGKLDPVFNQPSKGGGGQAFGEYETWVLMAVGANKVLQDLFSIQSDDLRAINVLRNSIMEGADSFEIEGNNNNDHIFQVLMRSLCVEPKIDQEGNVSFHPMTDKEIRALSLTPVDIYDKNSLGSEEIFGPTSNSMAKLESRVRWSWMPLHCEIVHPFHIIKTKIYKYLLIVKREGKEFSRYKLSEMTDTVVRDIISCKAFVELAPFEGKRRYVVTYGDTQGKLTGFKALVEMLRNADLDDIRAYHKRLIAESSSELTIMKSKKMLRNLEDFEASGHKLTDFIISSIPVIPLSFRPKSKFEHIQQDFDYYYGRIMDEVYSYKTSASKSEEDVFKIFLRIVEFCGLPFKGYTKETSQYKPLIKYFTGRESSDKKHGRLRENVLKKRVLFSGRTVIVPSGDIKRPPTKIGIPYALCIKVWGPYIVRLLSDMFFRLNLSENLWRELLESTTNKLRFARLVAKYGIKDYPVDAFYDKIYGIVCNYVEGYRNPETGEEVIKPKVVIAGRQPSLHKFSIRAYHPVIVEGKAIEIHPIVCGAYNADFDGDQMWFAALVNESACEEAIRLLSPKEGVINPKDGSLALEHSQDIRLGVYYATMLRDNVDNIKKHPSYDLSNLKYYNSVGTLEADIELGLAHVHDLVCFNYEGRSYLSTAGRILFNSLIPKGKGFTKDPFSNVLGIEGINTECYNDLKFDGLISGNGGTRKTHKYLSLGKITRWSYTEFDADANLEFFQKVSEFGFKHSDMSGISLSLDDLKEHPDTQKFIDRANEYAEIINRRYYNGSLSDEERKEELIYLYSKLKEKISERFMDTFDRNNNMFIIYDSGARGNKDQIMQACGIIGVLQKSKDEVLETPVLSNYTKGASCFETLQLSFSTRTGVASTQNETSVSGELTRLAVYMASGFRIVEEDCGAEAERVKVKYGDPLGVVLGPNGEKCTIQDLRGKQVLGDSSVLKKLQPFLDRLGRITDKSLEVLLKKKITNVKCEDGTYQILYKMDTMMSSFLNLRYAEGLEGLKDGKYITEATIASIERKGLTHVRMRNILACRSTGGCCAKCYGLKYDTLKLPRIGEFVGVESAQSIGEPASQLTLSLFHKGGAAGASVDKGVELYSSTLKGGFPKNLKAALLAPKEGHVHIDTVGKYVFVEDEVVGFTSENLTVDDGEHVDKWEPLTSGFVMPSEEVMNPTLEYIRFVQMSLLEVHFRIFEVNNIKVNARHFEIFARLQTSLVTIYESDDPEFKVGEDYEFNKIWNKGALDKVRFIFKVSKDTEVIRAFGGLLTQMAHGHLSDTLGRAVLGSKVSKTNSLISMLMQGRNVSTGAVKLLNPPKYMGVVTEVPITKEDDNKVANILVSGDIIEEITQAPVDPFSDVDWGDLLGSPEIAEPTEPTKEVYIKLDEEEVGEEKEVREVKKMDLFN